MNRSDLIIGKVYSNGKKRETIRRILGFPYCPSDWVASICVRYLVIKGNRLEIGKEYTITCRSFVKWAAREAML
jgi:hypothetical protein